MSELKSMHIFINNSVCLTNNVYMVNLDVNKNTYYTLQQINNFKTAPINTMFKIYNPQHINLNNAEIMCTLNYCEKYNNFIIKSLTIMNKPYNKPNTNNFMNINKRIINNIHKKFNS
jgi:hypothetical protein